MNGLLRVGAANKKMNKEAYVAAMEKIEQFNDAYFKASMSVSKVGLDIDNFYGNWCELSIAIVEAAVNDTEHWTKYWAFETDYGKDLREGEEWTGVDDENSDTGYKETPFKTAADVYEIIKSGGKGSAYADSYGDPIKELRKKEIR